MYPFIQKNRMNNMFPPRPVQRQQSFGMPQGFEDILGMILSLRGNEREADQYNEISRERRARSYARQDRNSTFPTQTRVPEIAQRIARPVEPKKPMDVVLQNQLSPYQEAQLEFRNRDLASREALAKQKQEESVRKAGATEEDRAKRTALLEEKAKLNTLTDAEKIELLFNNRMTAQTQGQRFTAERQEDTQKFTTERDANKAKLEKEMFELKDKKDQASMERKAQIDRDLAGYREDLRSARSESPSAEKTGMQVKYNKLINQKPEYRDWVKLEDGVITVAPVGKAVPWGLDIKGPTEDQRKEILSSLGMTTEEKKPEVKVEEKKDENKPPEGMKPGGRWVTTSRGRVYVEPS